MNRRAVLAASLAGAVALAALPAAASDAPLWMKFLRWTGGDSSATPVETHFMGPHMQMSSRQPAQAGDRARADAVLEAARRVLDRYRDVAAAEADGYRPVGGRGHVGEEIHYTNLWKAGREARTFDLERPGSLLYRREAGGRMAAVGVMYGARREATAAELDARLPLSVATWHRHVHFCGWPAGTPSHDFDAPGARFGFAGSIDTEAACAAAGGHWIPLVFGWMAHVYPHETTPERIWIGEQMLGDHAR